MFKSIYAIFALMAMSSVHAYTCSCSGRDYNNTDIFGAVNKGFGIDQAANQPDGKFPHRYLNGGSIEYPWCGDGHYAEYPLVKVPPGPYESGDAGLDRVVYLVGWRRTFCGCMTLADNPKSSEDLVLCTNAF